MAFSQVCRAWRDISLGIPLLWTELHGEDAYLAAEMMRRAGSQPVSLQLTLSPRHTNWEWTWQCAVYPAGVRSRFIPLAQPISLRKLDLSGSCFYIRYMLTPLAPEFFLLEALGVHVIRSNDPLLQEGPPSPSLHDMGIPQGLRAPALKSLAVTDCRISRDMPYRETITSLHVKLHLTTSLYSQNQFLDCLEAMPHLMCLKVDTLGHQLQSRRPNPNDRQHVSLPKLEHLHVTEHIQAANVCGAVASALGLFRLPATTEIRVSLAKDEFRVNLLNQGVVRQAAYPTVQGSRILRNLIGVREVQALFLDFTEDQQSVYAELSQSHHSDVLGFPWGICVDVPSHKPFRHQRSPSTHDWFGSISSEWREPHIAPEGDIVNRNPTLSTVKELRMRCDSHHELPEADHWKSLFQVASSVTRIEAIGGMALSLVVVLADAVSNRHVLASVMALEELTLASVDLSTEYAEEDGDEDEWSIQCSRTSELLRGFVGHRARAGKPLHRLVLRQCRNVKEITEAYGFNELVGCLVTE
jgi:hypothetical protein